MFFKMDDDKVKLLIVSLDAWVTVLDDYGSEERVLTKKYFLLDKDRVTQSVY